MAAKRIHALVKPMDTDARRELDIVWEHGIGPLREDIKTMRTEVREDLKGISNAISSTRKLVITTLVTAVPAWIGLYLSISRK